MVKKCIILYQYIKMQMTKVCLNW